MKLEEIKNQTNEAVSYVLEAFRKRVKVILTEYLNAMARFHNYSFGKHADRSPGADGNTVTGIYTWVAAS